MSAIEHPDIFDGNLAIATHYIGVSGDAALVHSLHLKWDGVIVGSITVQSSNFDDVALNSTTAGDWIAETSVAAITPAASAAGAMVHIGNMGAKRLRLVAVISTAGRLRVKTHGKQ